jgi:uncharacterized protein with FMN-binding domain
MKRAILVSTGTVAGLAAVLTYSGGDQVTAVAASAGAAAGAGSVTGGPPPLPSDSPSDTSSPSAAAPAGAATTPAAATTAAAAPTKAATSPKAAAATTTAAAPVATPTKAAATPTPVATTAAPKPTPKPTPTQTGPKDYVGSLQTHKYGQVQVGIRVQNKKIIAVWAVVAPGGASQPYSDFSIPVLKQETMAAQGTSIANVSGATLTWQSWKTSLQNAMNKAGL